MGRFSNTRRRWKKRRNLSRSSTPSQASTSPPPAPPPSPPPSPPPALSPPGAQPRPPKRTRTDLLVEELIDDFKRCDRLKAEAQQAITDFQQIVNQLKKDLDDA